MKVADTMTANVQVALPDMDVGTAARLMAELDVGALPVVEDGRVVGMITDRDIAVRAVALRRSADTKVSEAMTPAPRFCWSDDELGSVVAGMARLQLRRLPVLDRGMRLAGIISLSDIVVEVPAAVAGSALLDITEPGGPYSQADEADPYTPVAPPTVATDGDEPARVTPAARHFAADE